jgi:hypothetical protein
MRLSGRRGAAAAQRPMQFQPMIICPVCGLRNDITVRFCRNCGLPLGAPRDPVRGTTTKRADLPSDRGTGIAAIIGLAVVVGIVGGAGALIYKGFQANASGGPGASFVAIASNRSGASPGSSMPSASGEPSSSGRPGVSQAPAASGEPVPTDEPGATAAPTPRPTKTPVSTITAWTCKSGSIGDPLKGRWRIERASWNSGATSDRLTLALTRMSGGAKPATSVKLEFISPGKAASLYGITRPVGDRALVITFDGPITVGIPKVGIPGLRAIESVDVRRDTSGVAHAVIGVSGDGCARLNVPDWRSGADKVPTADVLIDVRH